MMSHAGVDRVAARVLIVDDEQNNRTLLEIMLEPEGYVLSTAGSRKIRYARNVFVPVERNGFATPPGLNHIHRAW